MELKDVEIQDGGMMATSGTHEQDNGLSVPSASVQNQRMDVTAAETVSKKPDKLKRPKPKPQTDGGARGGARAKKARLQTPDAGVFDVMYLAACKVMYPIATEKHEVELRIQKEQAKLAAINRQIVKSMKNIVEICKQVHAYSDSIANVIQVRESLPSGFKGNGGGWPECDVAAEEEEEEEEEGSKGEGDPECDIAAEEEEAEEEGSKGEGDPTATWLKKGNDCIFHYLSI
uniref:Uncharacterized protein n=1 Tax=Sphaerodactylus townsendi TaxID=933632 RepID=A0ACB8EPK9_9SAUR